MNPGNKKGNDVCVGTTAKGGQALMDRAAGPEYQI